MAGDLLYLDSSALTKLVRPEAETEALQLFLSTAEEEFVTSLLARIEVHRALNRASKDPGIDQDRLRFLFASLNFLPMDEVATSAARLHPPTLRSLDAIHLASALSLGNQLAGFVAYDSRLADAARDFGIRVYAPAAPTPR